MRDPRTRFSLVVVVVAILSALAWVASCGGSTSTSKPGTSVNLYISDPPLCAKTSTNPNGPFLNAWVTITKVTANTNAAAGPSDSGWQTLVDLTSHPAQIDLFSTVSASCALTKLTTNLVPVVGQAPLPAGDYSQIRLYLLADGSGLSPSSNACGTGAFFNCVVDSAGAHELVLSSQAQSGLKIPSGQIAGGKFSVVNGQATDLNISFNSCASIVAEGSGTFRLEPVLTAGEVSLNNNGLSGTVTDTTGNPISGAIVLLETPSNVNGAIVDTPTFNGGTVTGSAGTFEFCPLTGGPYDVVVTGQDSVTGNAFNPTVVFNVPVGTALGTITLVSENGAVGGGPAAVSGTVTTDAASIPVTLYTLQSATPAGGAAVQVTVPVLAVNATSFASTPAIVPFSQAPNVVTAASSTSNSCGTGISSCFGFFLQVPASGPQVYTFSSGSLGTPVAPTSTTSATYSFTAAAADCSAAPTPSIVNTIAVTPGSTAGAGTVSFTVCAVPM